MTVYQKEYLLKGWHTQQGLVSSTMAGCSLEILRLGQLLSYEAGTEDLKNHWYSVCVGRLKMLMSTKDDRNRVDRCSHQQEVKAGRQAGRQEQCYFLLEFLYTWAARERCFLLRGRIFCGKSLYKPTQKCASQRIHIYLS